ncbi:MAG: hypothetical protein ABIS06_07215 [Vicinamibacterales bacterium]
MQPEDSANRIDRLLQMVQRRRTTVQLCVALTTSLAVFAVTLTALRLMHVHGWLVWTPGFLAGSVAGWMVFARGRGLRTLAAAAAAVECVRPECRNAVITAEEIHRHPERAKQWIADRVFDQAAEATRDLRPGVVVPATRAARLCVATLVAVLAVVLTTSSKSGSDGIVAVAGRAAAAVGLTASVELSVTVSPPAYTGAERKTFRNPESLDVLHGSRLTIQSTVAGLQRVRFGTEVLGDLTTGKTIEVIAAETGYLAIEGAAGGRRLIPLSVTPDRLPTVRVERPGTDLLLPDASRTIPLRVTAADDLGLQMLELRYTKVSGTGEQFEFVEGTIPVRLDRVSARDWQGDSRLELPGLALEPGDSLVYRAIARDGRPGSEGVAASDTYVIEIAGPGQVALDAVEMPPEDARYALSQQMIVLKIERLQAKERTLGPERLAEETANIAAEQRAVRANFVFLLGGHVEDEEVEAEQSSEISEGRLQNTARRDVDAAIREMTRAEQGLAAIDTGRALPPARAAVAALQRAFGKSRYLLRALPGGGRIDPSRRLTGTLTTAASWRRYPLAQPDRDGRAARDLLSELTQIKAETPIDRHRIEQLAERALSSSPSSAAWQDISQRLLQLRAAATIAARRALLDEVIAKVQRQAARGLLPRTALPHAVSPLQRAWEGKE